MFVNGTVFIKMMCSMKTHPSHMNIIMIPFMHSLFHEDAHIQYNGIIIPRSFSRLPLTRLTNIARNVVYNPTITPIFTEITELVLKYK
jgi:hypothetical protein